MVAWFPNYMLAACRRGWQEASVEERCWLSALTCCCKAMYLRIARQILESTTHEVARLAIEDLHCLDAMPWGAKDLHLAFGLTEDFCRREDGAEFMLSRCHQNADQVQELLSISSSHSIGVCTGGRGLLCKRALTWNDLACDAWTLVTIAFCAKMMARDVRSLASLEQLHGTLKAPKPSRLRSWPCRKSFDELKSVWAELDPRGRRAIAELRAEMFWYLQACDVAVVAVSLLHLQRNGIHVPVTMELLNNFRRSSQLLSEVLHEETRLSLSEAFCERADALEFLRSKAVWQTSQRNTIYQAVFQCDWKQACDWKGTSGHPYPLVAGKGSNYLDVERVAATLLLDRLLYSSTLIATARADTTKHALEEVLRKQRSNEARQARKKRKKQPLDKAPAKGPPASHLSHKERYLTRRLLEMAPSWDTSCLRVRWTFLELEEEDDDMAPEASLYFDL